MTVIAFSDGVIAADSKVVDSNGLVFRGQKLFKLSNGTILGTAGDFDDRDVREILSKASPSRLPSRKKLSETKTEFEGIWVLKTGSVFLIRIEQDDQVWSAEVINLDNEPFIAVGHGAAYAIGAMAAGKSAVEAVEITCKYDNNCGLPVDFLEVPKKKQ